VLELGDAELEVLDVILRHQAKLAEEPVERRPCLLAEASGISAPARGHLLDERPRLVTAHHSTVGELVGERVRPLRSQRGGADRCESDSLEEVPDRAVVIWLGREGELGADVGARASTRLTQRPWQEPERVRRPLRPH
jgi:hypothetical protein